MLRSNISAREREKAERATLVQQDKLIKAKVGRGLLRCQVEPMCLLKCAPWEHSLSQQAQGLSKSTCHSLQHLFTFSGCALHSVLLQWLTL